MRLLFVIGSLEVGGAESQMVMLAGSLARLRHQCAVFVLVADGPLRERLREAGVEVHDAMLAYHGTWLHKMFSLFIAQIQLWFTALRFRPDVLHAYLPLTNLMGALAGRAALVPVVITSRRGLGNHQDRNPGWKWLDRVANRLSTKVTVNSRAVARDTLQRDGVAEQKLVCIYNGLDAARFDLGRDVRERVRAELGARPGEFLWLKVANLIPYKGHADLLQAFARVSSKASRLILVGEDRGIQGRLQEQARELGIADRVSFMGRRDDVPRLLSAMDGYVMASHEEGFSNAILEAMAAGLAIVATDVGGNREALQDGRAGVLVTARSSELLARAMEQIMSDGGRRAEFSREAAHAARELYSVEAMVTAYLALYLHASGSRCGDV